MVVAHTQPDTSTPAAATNASGQPIKKNRRKQSKKTAPRIAAEGVDQDMEESTAAHPLPASLDPAAQQNYEDDDLMIDADGDAAPVPATGAPVFAPLPANAVQTALKSETRRIPIPPHRMTPLKKDWLNIFGPLTEILGLQIRMNVQRRAVEIRVRLSAFFRACSV